MLMLLLPPEITSCASPKAQIQFTEVPGPRLGGSQSVSGRLFKSLLPYLHLPPDLPPGVAKPPGLHLQGGQEGWLQPHQANRLSWGPEAKPRGLSQQVSCPPAPRGSENTSKRGGPVTRIHNSFFLVLSPMVMCSVFVGVFA